MRIRLARGDVSNLDADVVACFAHEGQAEPQGPMDPALRRQMQRQMRVTRFAGRAGDLMWWNDPAGRRYLVVGLGGPRPTRGEVIRTGSARAARAASGAGARRIGLGLPGSNDVADEARAAIEGAVLGAYQFERHLTEPSRRASALESIEIATSGTTAARRAVRLGEAGARAVCLARDLVNEGPSRMDPSALARAAATVARACGLEQRTLLPRDLRRLGFHALCAVARGSRREPRVVHLRYRPKGRPRSRIVLVGKGVTFDSGGLNLKPADSMLTMKMDMAGAAAVLAAMGALREVGCRAEVHGVLGLVENMGGGDAYKPGDILDTHAGKSVEVMNTDAEGRLVLCDLLAWAASRLRPDTLVDLATLTGACVVALGPRAAGVFSRHDDLARTIQEAARAAGEKLWRMPLYDEYLAPLQQGPADLRSTGGRSGGAITAALFLGEFVPRDLPWLHIDMAGPAYTEHDLPDARAGGTGAGVLTLVRWLETL